MVTSRKIVLALSLALAAAGASSASAQIEAGLLGRRTFGASLFTETLRNRNIDNGYGGDLSLNVPVAKNLDASFGASYERFSDFSVEDKRLFGSLRAFHEFQGLRPFLDVSLISTHQSSKVGSISYSDSDGIWAGGLGAEIPVGDATAVTGRIAYHRFFKSTNGHYTTYALSLHHWFNERVGGQASVLCWESDSIVYSVGLTFRF